MTLSKLRLVLRGLYYFVYYIVCILLIGSAFFGLCFLCLGLLFTDYSPKELLLKGLSVGFRYAGVWAGGSALVLSVMRLIKTKSSKARS